MNQVKDMEDFYGHLDQYAQTVVSSNRPVDNPYIPQPLLDTSHPIKNTSLVR